jgi:hypothetical protein
MLVTSPHGVIVYSLKEYGKHGVASTHHHLLIRCRRLHFEPSLDALSLRCDVMSLVKMFSPANWERRKHMDLRVYKEQANHLPP